MSAEFAHFPQSLSCASVDDQVKLQGDFQFVMGVLAVIGHDPSTMIDCSEVLPVPPTVALNPHFPAGLGMSDVEQAVSELEPLVVSVLRLILDRVVRFDSLPLHPICAWSCYHRRSSVSAYMITYLDRLT